MEVGWYSASYLIYGGLLVLPVLISPVLLTRLSGLFTIDMALFSHLMNRGLRYVFVMSLLVIGNGIILSENIISLLYGADYSQPVLA
jgi:O-antigen/teichoic acid export membrane protein